jgi:hypothetical protein
MAGKLTPQAAQVYTDLTGKNHNNSVFLSKVEGAGIHFLIRYSLFDISYSNIVVKLSETHWLSMEKFFLFVGSVTTKD